MLWRPSVCEHSSVAPQLKRISLGGCETDRMTKTTPALTVFSILLVSSCVPQRPPEPTLPSAHAFARVVQAAEKGMLAGIVVDSVSGDPVGSAVVELLQEGSGASARVMTDSLGLFAFSKVEDGEYKLRVLFIAYCPKQFTVHAPPPPGFALVAAVRRARCAPGGGPDHLDCSCP